MDDKKMIGFWIDMDEGGRTEFSKERSVSAVDELIAVLRGYKKILVEIEG